MTSLLAIGETCGTKRCEKLQKLASEERRLNNVRKGKRKQHLELMESVVDAVKQLAVRGNKEKLVERLCFRARHETPLLGIIQRNNQKVYKRYKRILGAEGMKSTDYILSHFLRMGDVPRCVMCRTGKYGKGLFCRENLCYLTTSIPSSKETMYKRYGGTGFGVEHISEKAKSTMLERHGVEFAAKNPEIRAKGTKTHFERTGFENPNQTPAARLAVTERYKDKKFVERVRKNYETTMEERYGVNWRSMLGDRLATARYKWHKVSLGQGYVFNVQGYEPYVLRELVHNGCKPQNIEMYARSYHYEYKGARHTYRPDVFVKGTDLIVEVKSTYTAGFGKGKTSKELWKALVRKSKVVAESGDTLTLCVVNASKTNPSYLKVANPHLFSRRDVMAMEYKAFTHTQ